MFTFDEIKKKLSYYALGEEKKRVAVLGAFDTWVFMHNVAIYLAQSGYTALTSRYIYYNNPDSHFKYSRWPHNPTDQKQTMKEFLQNELILPCSKAIIIYSVPAAHYNEVEWCSNYNKDTLGIAFVRSIEIDEMCPDCIIDIKYDYAYCIGEDTAWKCISKSECPFKKQEIAKNQLEYFTKKENMSLIAVEKIEKVNEVIDLFLNGNLKKPKSRPFVFEFRFDIDEDEFIKLKAHFDSIVKKYNDQDDNAYEFIDYYFKPINMSEIKWFEENRTFRLREWNHPIKSHLEYIHSDIKIMDDGFVTLNKFGYENLLKTALDRKESRKFGEGLNLHEFLRIEKEKGYKYKIKQPFPYTIYLEKINAANKSGEIDCFSCEIEYWINNYDDKKNIKKKQDKLIDFLKLKNISIYTYPLQKIMIEKLQRARNATT